MLDLIAFFFLIDVILDIMIKIFKILVSISTVIVAIIALINIRFTKKAIDHNERQFNFLVKNNSIEINPLFHIKRVKFELSSQNDLPSSTIWRDYELVAEIENIGNGVARNVNIEVFTSINHEYIDKINKLFKKYNITDSNFDVSYGLEATRINNLIISNVERSIYEDYIMPYKEGDESIKVPVLDIFIIFMLISFNLSRNSLFYNKENIHQRFDFEQSIPKLFIRVNYENIEGKTGNVEFIGETKILSHSLKGKDIGTRGYLQFKKSSTSQLEDTE
ncbi:hypothetical protein GLV94_03030 [Virgibacillus halodenitrificans]|uniref:hypothetical protein n=1 Tax=Virgibacillus halodenitrificans TaxID=1482 RepID=UPI00136843B6|nr:hypothetical protein [Virgibacillus halodenitrificans]MYL44607.1 hypothetical protein [Virgibacillus halodenitrificans]